MPEIDQNSHNRNNLNPRERYQAIMRAAGGHAFETVELEPDFWPEDGKDDELEFEGRSCEDVSTDEFYDDEPNRQRLAVIRYCMSCTALAECRFRTARLDMHASDNETRGVQGGQTEWSRRKQARANRKLSGEGIIRMLPIDVLFTSSPITEKSAMTPQDENTDQTQEAITSQGSN